MEIVIRKIGARGIGRIGLMITSLLFFCARYEPSDACLRIITELLS